MIFKASKRINAIGETVDVMNCVSVADIGCDHGYTSILIAKRNPNIRVIACDIGKKPLSMAKSNIIRSGLESRIETRHGGGFSCIQAGEVDCAVLSGMGGLLIIDILSEGKNVADKLKQLVLQPQRDICEVRKYLHRNNFTIKDEVMIFEDGKYYTIINAVKGTEKYINEYDYIYGKKLIERNSEVFRSYIEHTVKKEKQIIESLIHGNTEESKKRYTEVIERYKCTLEVFKCLQR